MTAPRLDVLFAALNAAGAWTMGSELCAALAIFALVYVFIDHRRSR